MKSFNAARVVTSVRGTTNQQVHLADSIGRPLELNLSPPAQQQFLQVLLSTAPMRDGSPSTARVLQIQGVKPHTLDTGNCALELLLGPNQAIRIEFPAEGLDAFQQALAKLGTSRT